MISDRPEGIRTSVELCVKALRGTKKIDLFENARVSRETPLAEQYKVLKGLVDEGEMVTYLGNKRAAEACEHAPVVASDGEDQGGRRRALPKATAA